MDVLDTGESRHHSQLESSTFSKFHKITKWVISVPSTQGQWDRTRLVAIE